MEPKPIHDRQRIAAERSGRLDGYFRRVLGNSSGGFFIPEPIATTNEKMQGRMREASFVRGALDHYVPEDLPLGQKLSSLQRIIADEAKSNGRTIHAKYTFWHDLASDVLSKRAVKMKLAENTATLSRGLKEKIEKMSAVFGQASMLGKLYDLDLFFNQPNPFESQARLLVSGIDDISFALVEDGDQEADEKIVLHLPVRRDGQIKTGCLVEGDSELLFWHEGDKCKDLEPVSQNAPDRYIY